MGVPAIKATRESIRYGFAVGKVRVLETKVFTQSTYERLLDAADFAEQRRILSDTVYGRYLEGAETSSDVERGLDQALDDFYAFLDESNLPDAVVRFFREPHDFANLKGALKAELLGIPADGLLVGLGTIPVEDFAGPLEDLPAPFGPLAERVLSAAQERGAVAKETSSRQGRAPSSEPAEGALKHVDSLVDAGMFVELARLGRESKSTFLRDLASLQVDIANLKALLRARLAGVPAKDALEAVLEGGNLPAATLADLYETPLSDIGARLAALPFLSAIPASEFADISQLDVVADNLVVEHLRRARLVPFGAEPVIAYVMGREAEVRAVRTLLLGRLAGISTEVLRARLRNLYV